MNNKYLRLFVALTKLMTAEKMRLDRFCQPGEYLAYKIALPPKEADLESTDDVDYIFSVSIRDQQYHFTHKNTREKSFALFETELSNFLNELFRRKTEFEQQQDDLDSIQEKLISELTESERRTLAQHIDAKSSVILRMLGVVQ